MNLLFGLKRAHNKLFKQIRHAWHFWFAVALVIT